MVAQGSGFCYITAMTQHVHEVKSATLLRFNDIWKRNFHSNLKDIQRNPGVVALKNCFRKFPGIVIGAGPSLDKNIRLLRQVQGKAVLIACDAALKPLLAHGIIPPFVTCLDPQEDITKFLKGVSHKGITLIAPTIIHPQVLDLWEGQVVFYNKFAPDIPVLTEIQNQLPKLGCLTPGGTVLSIAYDLAFQTGCNPILFLGQDLSYPKKVTYSRDSENAEEVLGATLEKQQDNIVYEQDMTGRILPTLKSMLVSKQWFNWAFTTWKRDGKADIVNCSEAGILTDHCRLMPFGEAIFRYCKAKINIPWAMKKALNRKR